MQLIVEKKLSLNFDWGT